MADLINSFVKFSTAMTLFGLHQLRNAVEVMVDVPRWTFTTAFTCPDCGSQQEIFRDLNQTLDDATKSMTARLSTDGKAAFERFSRAGSDIVERTFQAADAVYPVRDDKHGTAEERIKTLSIRGHDQRSTPSALDPRTFFDTAEELVQRTTVTMSDWTSEATASLGALESAATGAGRTGNSETRHRTGEKSGNGARRGRKRPHAVR